MATTIDHLRVDHRVTILSDFVDARGTAMHAGDSGILRALSFDQIGLLIQMEIEREHDWVSLTFELRALDGPRNGHMREFFEMGEDVSEPTATAPRQNAQPDPRIEGPDRLVDMEEEMRRKFDHIGVAVSIAEVYAERMRAFRAAGDEARAVAAFKLAKDWMGTYASWATSGGEGAANSYERDRFCEGLVAELGYDPTATS